MSVNIPSPELRGGPIAPDMVKAALPLMIHEWTSGMRNISMPTRWIDLDYDQQTLLGPSGEDDPEWTIDATVRERAMERLRADLDSAAEQLGGYPVIVKVGARAPKDATFPHPPAVRSFDEFMIVVKTSMRMMDDMVIYRSNKYIPKLYVRQMQTMQACDEWRCMILNRRLAAISQYDYRNYHQILPDEAEQTKALIQQWVDKSLAPNLHIDSLVADVHVQLETREISLIEVNPLGYTDPCLIDLKGAGWNPSGDFTPPENPQIHWIGIRSL